MLSVNVIAVELLTDVFGLVPTPSAPNERIFRLGKFLITPNKSDPVVAVEVKDSFSICEPISGTSHVDGRRTLVKETSSRCKLGQIVIREVIELSDKAVCRSFNVFRHMCRKSESTADKNFVNVESVYIVVQHANS